MLRLFLSILAFAFYAIGFCLPYNQGEVINNDAIKSIKLFPSADQTAYPIIPLNAEEQLELHFDDIGSSIKNYFYTYQLCDADWTPVNLSQFDYIKGFSQVRITQFRQSSVSLTRYVHYFAKLPARNCMPSRSGNYLLKVFENGDTSKLVFTKKVMIAANKAGISATVTQPFSGNDYRAHQRVVVGINAGDMDLFNVNQQIKVVVLQNYQWENAQLSTSPTFIRNKQLEYNQEGLFDFEGGKEWRWLDLRSFRLQSDRVKKAIYSDSGTNIYVSVDTARPQLRYQFYKDLNGMYTIEMLESYNPWWQSDYAKVHFTFVPSDREFLKGKDIYLTGELTQFQLNDNNKMRFNDTLGIYEKDLFLKNGYYSYAYVVVDQMTDRRPIFKFTEGNSWDTENNYTALVYYRSIGGRADELLGAVTINSLRFIRP